MFQTELLTTVTGRAAIFGFQKTIGAFIQAQRSCARCRSFKHKNSSVSAATDRLVSGSGRGDHSLHWQVLQPRAVFWNPKGHWLEHLTNGHTGPPVNRQFSIRRNLQTPDKYRIDKQLEGWVFLKATLSLGGYPIDSTRQASYVLNTHRNQVQVLRIIKKLLISFCKF